MQEKIPEFLVQCYWVLFWKCNLIFVYRDSRIISSHQIEMGGRATGKAMKSSSTAMNNKNNKPSAARVAKKNKAPAAKKDGDESRSPHG